ncbi:unnamed protein product [Fusarium langsethiae]|nr:unnamed protein product [Fusarium langsethiae]
MRLTDCQLGDAYQDDVRDEVIERLRQHDSHWESEHPGGEYLNYVNDLIPSWPQLELLADFMGVGTIPTRWQMFPGENDLSDIQRYTYRTDDVRKKKDDQQERLNRVNIALLHFNIDCASESISISDVETLRYQAEKVKCGDEDAQFSLFVVEDLSYQVIETLGSKFGIDPRFFRAHIIDYAWNNVRDRWREPPSLDLDARER